MSSDLPNLRWMQEEAREQGYPDPVFLEIDFSTATFYPNSEVRARGAVMRVGSSMDPEGSHHGSYHASSPADSPERGDDRQTIQSALALKDDEHFRKAYLLPHLKQG